MKIKIAETDAELIACFPAMKELRPLLEQDAYLVMVKRMIKGGYYLAMLELENGDVPCVGGFRIDEMFHRGKGVYVDDLSTMEIYRSKGYGAQVIDFIVAFCKDKGCECIHLDSGVQRFAAHRFYLRKGFDITAHHFAKKI
ncbi:MAG TPA: GNAT family N-acetyltransferase [Bacteroidia bacterium]|nr:GNAT family N-acetyltransferase [Bacteroidia bacterium]